MSVLCLVCHGGSKTQDRTDLHNLGRSNSKEQYGFFYKEDEFNHIAAFHYNDSRFERPPFPNLWQIKSTGKLVIGLIWFFNIENNLYI